MWIKDLMDVLRRIAREPDATDVGLLAAERPVREFIDQYGGDPQKGIDELMKAVRAEAEANPGQKDFWMAVHELVILPNRFPP